MVLFQCELRASRWACWTALLLHGAVALLLLSAAWRAPAVYALLAAFLLALVVREWLHCRRRIRRRRGQLLLHPGQVWGWRQQLWQQERPPWVTRQAILLSLRNTGGQRAWLWLFADATGDSAWRQLRQLLLLAKAQDAEQ